MTGNDDKNPDTLLALLEDLAQYPPEAFNYPKNAKRGL